MSDLVPANYNPFTNEAPEKLGIKEIRNCHAAIYKKFHLSMVSPWFHPKQCCMQRGHKMTLALPQCRRLTTFPLQAYLKSIPLHHLRCIRRYMRLSSCLIEMPILLLMCNQPEQLDQKRSPILQHSDPDNVPYPRMSVQIRLKLIKARFQRKSLAVFSCLHQRESLA